MKRQTSFASIAVILVVGVLVAWAGGDGGVRRGGLSVFALGVLAAFVINWIVFVPSFVRQTEHFFDLTGSLTYLTLVVGGVALSWGATPTDGRPRMVLLALLVVMWAVRLGSFLFRRVRADGSDGRFDKIKPDLPWFLMSWTLQGLWVSLTLAAALAAITAGADEPLGLFAGAGFVLWVVGFGIEVVADQQKRAFRADAANSGRFITSGLWAWSRHPNYFGEILLWVGIAVIALPALSGWRFVGLVSPVFVTLLLTRVSGIPMLEARAKKKWRDDPAFQAYSKNVPVLIPKPPS